MAVVTPQEYYSDEDQFGNYQYVSLKDIMSGLELEAQDDDSYIKNTKRSTMLFYAKMTIKEVHKKASNEVLSIGFTAPNDCTWTLPQDFVEYVRVSVVVGYSNGMKQLQVLDVNDNINTATEYLQDQDAQIIFDENGQIITADANNAYSQPYQTYSFYEGGGQSRLNTAKLSEYGEFKIDKKRGKAVFSSQLVDKEIVLEYASDGLQESISEGMIMVHKYIEKTIRDGVYYAIIEKKRNVPSNEKERARRAYKGSLHNSKKDTADLNFTQIARLMRIQTMS